MLAQSASLLKQAMPMLAQVATATRHYQAIYDVGKYAMQSQQQLWPRFSKAVIDGCAKAFPRTASFVGLQVQALQLAKTNYEGNLHGPLYVAHVLSASWCSAEGPAAAACSTAPCPAKQHTYSNQLGRSVSTVVNHLSVQRQ
jgi:hypothetical protein